MNISQKRAIGDWLSGVVAFNPLTVTAGGGDDGVLKNGVVFDRDAFDQLILSAALFVLSTTASLGPATSTITVAVKDSADNVTFDAYETYTDVIKDTNDTTAHKYNVDLAGARRYIRVDITINFSAASVDTNAISAVLVLAPGDELPMTQGQYGS